MSATFELLDLKSAAESGAEVVKDLLQKNSEGTAALTKKEAIDNAKAAIAYLQEKKLDSLKDDAKESIIEVSRQILQAEIEKVSTEIQVAKEGKSAASSLKDLEDRKNDLVKSRDEAVKLETELADLGTRVGLQKRASIEVREVSSDVRLAWQEKDWVTLAKYAVSVAGAAAAAKWLYDHTLGFLFSKTIGTDEKPGFFRKALGFIATVGGAIAGVVGLKMWQRGQVTPGIKKAVDNALEGADKGLDPSRETMGRLGKYFKEGSESFNVLKNKDEYDSSVEFYADLAAAVVSDGYGLVWVGGALHLWDSGKHLLLEDTPGFVEAVINMDHDELIKVYATGTVVYATSIGAIEGVMSIKSGGLLKASGVTVGKSLTWPYQILKKTGVVGTGKFGYQYTMGTLRKQSAAGQYHWAKSRSISNAPAFYANRVKYAYSGSEGSVRKLIDEWTLWKRIEETAGGDTKLIKSASTKGYKVIGENIRRNLMRMVKNGEDISFIGKENLLLQRNIQKAAKLGNSKIITDKGLEAWLQIASSDFDEILFEIDEIIRNAGSVDDLTKAGHTIPRIAQAAAKNDDTLKSLCKLLDSIDDPADRAKYISALVKEGKSIEDIVDAGADSKKVLAAVKSGTGTFTDDVVRAATKAAEGTSVTPKTAASTAAVSKTASKTGRLGAEALESIKVISNGDDLVKARLIAHLQGLSPEDATSALVKLEAALGNGATDDVLRLMANEDGLIKVFSIIDDATPGLAAAKVGKFAMLMKGLVAVGVVGDTVSIAYAWYEWGETNKLRDRTPTQKEELRDLYAQRHYYQGAQMAIGVVGLGAVAIGGTAAAPIVLATLPITAALAAGYQWHKWEETVTRDRDDFQREYNKNQLVATLRYRPDGEVFGQMMDWALGDTDMWDMASMLSPVPGGFIARKVTTGDDDFKRIAGKSRSTNTERIAAVVGHMTSVKMPVVMREKKEDGTYEVRGLTEDEDKYYHKCLDVYVKAKIEFITNNAQGTTSNPIGPSVNVGLLLGQAETYARLKHDRFVVSELAKTDSKKALEMAKELGFPESESKDNSKVFDYAQVVRGRSIRSMLAQPQALIAAKVDDGEIAREKLKNSFAALFQAEAAPHMVGFNSAVINTNIKELWPDGDAGRVISTEVMTHYRLMVKNNSSLLAQIAIEKMQSVTDLNTSSFDKVVAEVKKEFDKSMYEMNGHFGERQDKSLKKRWENLSNNHGRLYRMRDIAEKQDQLGYVRGKKDALIATRVSKYHYDYSTDKQRKIRRSIAGYRNSETYILKELDGLNADSSTYSRRKFLSPKYMPKVPEDRYDFFRERAHLIHREMKNGQANLWFRSRCVEYRKLLNLMPEFDPNGSLRKHLNNIPDGFGSIILDDGLMDYYKKTVKLVRSNVIDAEMRVYEFHPHNRSKGIDKAPLLATKDGEPLGKNKEIYILREGETGEGKMYSVNPGKDDRTASKSAHMTTYDSREDGVVLMYKDKTAAGRHGREGWTFYGSKPGRYYIYTKSKGTEQPGRWIEVYEEPENRVKLSKTYDRYHSEYNPDKVEITLQSGKKIELYQSGLSRSTERRKAIKKQMEEYFIVIDLKGSGSNNFGFILTPRTPGTIKEVYMEYERDYRGLKKERVHVEFAAVERPGSAENERKFTPEYQANLDKYGLKVIANGIRYSEKQDKYFIDQPDGSVLLVGAKDSKGRRIDPYTLVDGVWLDIQKPLNENVARLILTPEKPFHIPYGRYKFTSSFRSDTRNHPFKQIVLLQPGRPVDPRILSRYKVEKDPVKNRWNFTPYGTPVNDHFQFVSLDNNFRVDVIPVKIGQHYIDQEEKNNQRIDEDGRVISIKLREEGKATVKTRSFPVYIPGRRVETPREKAPSVNPEIAQREQFLKQVKEFVPTLRESGSGRYRDSETSSLYYFRKNGDFFRSWGTDNATCEYIPPAIFDSGEWVEQEDPAEEMHLASAAERKAAAAKRASAPTPEVYDDENMPHDQEYEDSLNHVDKLEKTVELGKQVEIYNSSIAPINMKIICTMKDGKEKSFLYTGEHFAFGFDNDAPKPKHHIYDYEGEARKKFEGKFLAVPDDYLTVSKQALFTLDMKEVKETKYGFESSKYSVNLLLKSADVISIRTEEPSKEVTYSLAA